MADSIVVGLVAAAVTLVVAFLTQFVAEKFRRFHDGSALAAGIAGELSAYEDALPLLLKALKEWGELTEGHADLFLRPMEKPTDSFYSASAGKIGVLGPDLVADIVYVYSNINAFRVAFDILAKSFKEMHVAEFRVRASACYMVLNQAHNRGQLLIPKLRARALQHFKIRGN